MKTLIFKPQLNAKLDRLDKKVTKLWYLGYDPNELIKFPTVAVVGTRKPTPYGKTVTEQLVTDLVRAGVVIVSGLAFGIDIIAHKTALEEGGATIAVLPSGLDNVYPATHRFIATKIKERGALISEYPLKHRPIKVEFLERNRIIAAFCDLIIIPEAASHSGSLNTASHAKKMGITVCALPGPTTSLMSEGTNKIIKEGLATMITDAQDVLKLLNIKTNSKKKLIGNNEKETSILKAITSGIHDSTRLQHELKMDTKSFQICMTMLEIDGRVQQNDLGEWNIN
jgi:DNA processing protein